jgi:hypothetical protein
MASSKPKRILDETILVRISSRDLARIERAAKSDERFNGKVSTVVRYAVRDYLERTEGWGDRHA